MPKKVELNLKVRGPNYYDNVPIVPKSDVQTKFFCIDCGIELDEHDVTANLNMWGTFQSVCTDDCENHVDKRGNYVG